MPRHTRPARGVRHILSLAALSLIAPLALLGFGAGPGDDDDDEEKAFNRATAQRSVRENCLMCHSDELVVGQRLTPAQWKAEVEKMVGWGAPLPKDEQARVIDFLSREYPATAAPAPLAKLRLSAAAESVRPEVEPGTASPADAVARGTASYSRNCENCHGANGQGTELGPSLVEKPVLLRPTAFAEVVREGRGKMPGFGAIVEPATNAAMLRWLRSLRYAPPDGR